MVMYVYAYVNECVCVCVYDVGVFFLHFSHMYFTHLHSYYFQNGQLFIRSVIAK